MLRLELCVLYQILVIDALFVITLLFLKIYRQNYINQIKAEYCTFMVVLYFMLQN